MVQRKFDLPDEWGIEVAGSEVKSLILAERETVPESKDGQDDGRKTNKNEHSVGDDIAD